jgi:hypothetical protein
MRVDNDRGPFYSCSGEAEIKAKFRKLALELHPDRGGSHEAFLELVRARDAALAEGDCMLDMIGGEDL